MGLFDETAKAIPGQDVGETSTSGLGSLAAKAIQKAVDDGVLNNNTVNTPLSDLRSIIVRDPSRVDPSFDISGVRTTTPTRSELLAAVPEFSGFEYDPTQRSYIEDLYALYGGAVPTVDVAQDTAQIPGAVDTLVDVGGGGGMDQVTGGSVLDAPTDSGLTESGTFAGQPTFTTTPGTTVDNVTGDITNPDGSYGGNIVDEVALTGGTTTPVDTSIAIEDLTQPSNVGDFQITAASPLTNQTQITDPITPIQDLPMVTTSINRATGEVFDAQTGEEIGNLYDEVALTGTGTPEQKEGFLQNVLGRAGQTVDNALNELGKVPGAVVDFAKQTVDVFGRKLNVGKTLASAAINKLAGGPVSLIFDLLPEEDPADTLNRNIVDELKAEKDYGFNIQSGNLNQDPFGRNPVSLFGNYEQTLLEDATSTGTTKMALAKKEFAQDYFDKKAGKTAPQEDIGSVPGDVTTGADPVTGDLPGGGNIVDEFAPSDIQPTDPSLEIPDRGRGDGGGGQDTGPSEASVNEADVEAGLATESISDFQDNGGGGADMGSVSTAGQAGPPSQRGGGGGSSGGGGKIVCTMMNESYGFGSFRNKIWLRHSKDLAPEYQIGYHKIFLPLVKLSKKNIILKKILEHIAVHRTIDIRQESRGKVHLLGRIYRKILEPICYWVGKHD